MSQQTQVSDGEQDSGGVQADYFRPEAPRWAEGVEGKVQRQRARELSPSLPHQALPERAESTSRDWKPQFDSVNSCACRSRGENSDKLLLSSAPDLF